MYTGIKFNGKHSLKDFGLTVSHRDIGYPSKIKRQERVPFSNQVYDFSSVYGGQEYEERSLTYTFNIIGRNFGGYRKDYRETQILETAVMNWLMNTNGKVILKDDTIENYYFKAELVTNPSSEFRFIGSELTVEFTAYPFKISELPEGHDIWDKIIFTHDYLQNVDFTVEGSKEITLYNNGASVITPTVIASAPMEVILGNIRFSVPAGRSQHDDLVLANLENKLIITGNGTISFEFYKELI